MSKRIIQLNESSIKKESTFTPPHNILLRGDLALRHIRNLHAVSILSQLGGLHKIRDGLSMVASTHDKP